MSKTVLTPTSNKNTKTTVYVVRTDIGSADDWEPAYASASKSRAEKFIDFEYSDYDDGEAFVDEVIAEGPVSANADTLYCVVADTGSRDDFWPEFYSLDKKTAKNYVKQHNPSGSDELFVFEVGFDFN